MKTIIIQNGQVRECEINLGTKVKHPNGLWGRIKMFEEDDTGSTRLLIALIYPLGNTITGSHKGVYPHEIELESSDFEKGKLIF